MSELGIQLKAAAIELSVSKILRESEILEALGEPDYDGAVDNAIGHIERAIEIVETPEPESGPGFARFKASDTSADIARKMADAFAPLRAMRWAFHPNYRRRDERGRFLSRHIMFGERR